MSQYSFGMERYCYYCHFTPGKHASYAGITAAMDFISWKKKKTQNFHNTESQGNHSEEAAPWTVKTTFRSSVAHTAHDSSFSNLSQASCSASSNIIVQTLPSCLPALHPSLSSATFLVHCLYVFAKGVLDFLCLSFFCPSYLSDHSLLNQL